MRNGISAKDKKVIQIVNVGQPKDEGNTAEKVLRGAEKLVKAANGNGQPSKADLQRRVEDLERARAELQGKLDQTSQRYETLLTNTIPEMTRALGDAGKTATEQGSKIVDAVNGQGQRIAYANEALKQSYKDAARNVRNAINEQGADIVSAIGAQTEIIADEIAEQGQGAKKAIEDATLEVTEQGEAITREVKKQGDRNVAVSGEVKGAVNAVENEFKTQGQAITGAVDRWGNALGDVIFRKGNEIKTAVDAQGAAIAGKVNEQGQAIIAKENEVLSAVNTHGQTIKNAVDANKAEITAQGTAIGNKLGEVKTEVGNVKTAVDGVKGEITDRVGEVRKAVTIQGQKNRRAIVEASEFLSERIIGVGDKVGEVTIAVNGAAGKAEEVKRIISDYISDKNSLKSKIYTAACVAAAGAVAGLIFTAASYFGKSSPNIEKTVKEDAKAETVENKIQYVPVIEETPSYGYASDAKGRLTVWANSKQRGKHQIHTSGIVEEGADGLYKLLENKALLPSGDPEKRAEFIESLKNENGMITKTKIEEELKKYGGR
ncbi:Uncharacterised protein [uncultured archaeon]|nr:Uncharacterised protein [uncultured archaeon]